MTWVPPGKATPPASPVPTLLRQSNIFVNMKEKILTVPEEHGTTRLDVFLSEQINTSRSQIQKYIEQKRVLVNGELPKKSGHKLSTGDHITLLEEKSTGPVQLPDIEVVSETDQYLIIDKPAGVLVHPTPANEQDTLAAWILKHYPGIKGVGESEIRPGIVHRLDKEASGLLVIAKTQEMFEHLKKQFKQRTVDKEYYVLVYGSFENKQGIIDFDIDRGADGKMVARPKTDFLALRNATEEKSGKAAKTEYWVEKELVRFSFVRVKIYTGRMHQIRVHMFATGHPVVGDTLYENKKLFKKSDQHMDRLFLHAFRLGFVDLTGVEKTFQIGLPDNLQNYLDLL